MRRYQQFVRPYAGRIYVALAFVLALIGASGTIGQWNNWILFRHGGNFGVTDPQFHKDVGFYVFKLPFLTFVVDWTLAILIVTLAVSVVFHYFNGGIQPQRGLPRVRPPVKAHISVLLALIALDKAAGYVLQRWSLVNAQDGYVNGAGYTDVHARLPAETLLIYVSIFAAAILLFNIRRQGWTLPGAGRRDLGLRGPGRRHHLPGAAAGAQGHAGAELARGAVHPAQHHGHPGRLRPEQRAGAPVPGRHEHHAPARRSLADPHHRQHPAVGPRPDDLAADVPARAGASRAYYSFPSLGVDRYTVERAADAGAHRRARHLVGQPAVPVVGEHPPAVHPRQRGRGGAGQPDQLEQPGLRRPGRAADAPRRGCRPSPSPTSTSGWARPATSWRTPSSSRSTTSRTATASRATTRAPAGSSCRRSSPGPPSRCGWATSTS